MQQGDSDDYFFLIKISFGGHEGLHSLRLMCFVLQTVAGKKKANNLAFRLAALVRWLAHHSVVSGCYLADPWICVCVRGVAEEPQCPRNLICGAGPVGGIDHGRWNAFVLTKLGLFKYVNATVSQT